jgi:hypothetical protein
MVSTVNLGAAGLGSIWNIHPRLGVDAPATSLAGRIAAAESMSVASGGGSISAGSAASRLVGCMQPTGQLGEERAQSLGATPTKRQ